MAYVAPDWHNDTSPYINEDNLNAISQTLERVPIENGGTNATDAPQARINLGIEFPLPVENGGTGAATAVQALDNMGAEPKASVTDKGSTNTPVYFDSNAVARPISAPIPVSLGGTGVSSLSTLISNMKSVTYTSANTGANNKYVYISNGVVTASSATVGGVNQNMYLNGGTFTAGNSFVPTSGGTFSGNVTLNTVSGTAGTQGFSVLTLGNSNAKTSASNSRGVLRLYTGNSSGTNYKIDVYANATANRDYFFEDVGGGVVSHATGTQVGSASTPVYIASNGRATVMSSALPVSLGGTGTTSLSSVTVGVASKVGTGTVGSGSKPVYINAGTPTAFSATIGGTAKPVYVNAGTITAFSSTIGSGTKPVYMSGGTITASGSTVGSASVPVWMSSGNITAMSSPLGMALGGTGATGIVEKSYSGASGKIHVTAWYLGKLVVLHVEGINITAFNTTAAGLIPAGYRPTALGQIGTMNCGTNLSAFARCTITGSGGVEILTNYYSSAHEYNVTIAYLAIQ